MNAPAGSSTAEMPNLDLLRAVAVLLVLADHVLEAVAEQSGSSVTPFAWHIGRLGVLLFFVHTSCVLMWSMSRLNLNGAELIVNFYLRRVFRIYPLSLVCVATVLVIQVPVLPWREYSTFGTLAILSNLALATNIAESEPVLAPLWTLPIEIQTYLVLPFIFLLIRQRQSVWVTATLWATSVALAIVFPTQNPLYSVALFLPCFLSGVIAYKLQNKGVRQFPAALWMVSLAGVVAAYIGVENLDDGIHDERLAWLTCLVVGLLIPYFRQLTFRYVNIISHVIAKYSYGIYLFHCIAIWFGVYFVDAPSWLRWSIAMLTLMIMSFLGYHLIEKPAIDLGVRLSKYERVDAPVKPQVIS